MEQFLSYFAGPDSMTKGQGHLSSSVLHGWSLPGVTAYVSAPLGAASDSPDPPSTMPASFTALTAYTFIALFVLILLLEIIRFVAVFSAGL